MEEKVFKGLKRGDIVRHKDDHDSYIVDANYGNRVTAVRTEDMTNPLEWELVLKCRHRVLKK